MKFSTHYNLRTTNWQRGFTIVELLVVISIIGILATTVMATLDPIGQIQKGRDAKRKADLAQIKNALETYYQDYGYYPAQCSGYRIQNGITCIEWGGNFGTYMQKLPKDEDPDRLYRYVAGVDKPQTYYLYASLQRGTKDAHICNANGTICTNATGIVCGISGQVCNYGISSPNTSP